MKTITLLLALLFSTGPLCARALTFPAGPSFEVTLDTFLFDSGDELSFGTVEPGNDSLIILTMRNSGHVPFDLTAITLNDGTSFSVTDASGLLEVGDSLFLELRYSPTTPGAQMDVLTINTDAAGSLEINLVGRSATTAISQQSLPTRAIYPNPTPGNLTLELKHPIEKGHWQVFDTAGKVLLNGAWPGAAVRHDLDLSSLQVGSYTVVLVAGQQRFTARVLRQ